MAEKAFTLNELYEAWPVLSTAERVEGFELLQRQEAEEFFLQLNAQDKAQVLQGLRAGERRLWIRLLPPHEATKAFSRYSMTRPEARSKAFSTMRKMRPEGL